MDRLRQSAGVTNITYMQGIAMHESVVNWTWNGQQSPVIDGTRGARMWLHSGVVSVIELPLTVSLARVWDALGQPESVRVVRSPRIPPAVFYQASYFSGGLSLRATVTCPLGTWNTLAATVDAQIQAPAELSARNLLLTEPQGCP